MALGGRACSEFHQTGGVIGEQDLKAAVTFLCLTRQGERPHSLARIYVPRDLESAELPWPHPGRVETREVFTARLPTPEEASTLRLSATLAVLAITRVSADITGRVIEVARLTLPGDRAEALFTTHHTIEERRTKG
ncbi:UTRA domain-containing protein [Streptomyces sp. NPDC048266]|uniref:UTRA domain-containing protein n=1 Tax=Streptomyces sp. NPDC048266 TaxID=3155787 RepID=UPI0033CA7542